MKHLAIVALLASTAAADVSLLDNNKTVTVDCTKDPKVSLLGNHLVVTLQGACAELSVMGNHEKITGSATKVSVAGNHNALAIDQADEISVAGNNNVLTYKKGVKKGKPQVSVTGRNNSVTPQK
jgi:hypothetical protein